MLNTSVPRLRQIYPSPDAPIFFLTSDFPEGIPVRSQLLSIDGIDCWELCPVEILNSQAMKQLAIVMFSEEYPLILLERFFDRQTVLIPLEWTQEADYEC